ncbi:hypothetical protein Tco_0441629, partial [Tanacetum coccineum]
VRKSFSYAFSDSLLLTPLCCDDIHDVTPHVSTLAGCDILVAISPLIRRKYHDLVAFTTGCRKIKCKWKRCNRKIRIPIGMWPCKVEEKMTLKEVDGKMIEEIETKIIIKDGIVTRKLSSYQIKKGMSMSVQKSQVHKMAKFSQDGKKKFILG